MAQIQSSIVFSNFPGTNSQVTASLLNNHVNNATLVSGAIADQVSAAPLTGDSILIQRATALHKATIQQLVDLVTAVAVPIGCIMMWGTDTPPVGWLHLNGQASPASLVPLFGATIPDMRGYFPRGWAAGSSAIDPQGATRAILSEQPHAMQTHTHNYTRTDGMTLFMTSGPDSITQIGGTSTQTTSAPTGSVSPFENRPVNKAVMFIVKYQ